ncbi:MAG: Mur ligase family protein [Minisyncoccia bacterium]
MGANHVGEIAELCRIAEPTHGLITNIGRAHIGSFGGHENIVRGKTELYRFLEQADASSFVNGADRLLLTESNTTEKITYLSADSDYPVISKNTSPLVSCSWRDLDIQTQLTGEYNLSNIAVAIAVGDYFDVPAVNIKKGLEKYIPENNRSQIVQTDKKNTIIKDYYNANRSSMELALLNLANMNTEQEKIAILGDIGDLEDYSHDEHLAVINFALELDIQKIIVVGKEFSQVHVDSEKVTQYEHVDNALVDLQDMNIRNSIVLLKASRGPKPLPVFEVLFSDVDW